ncbi:RNA 2',3'-cyclic phosphodiesterase [Acidianus sulfidivorans JP7]|uniref:RNA 2',3'-cyclic phosphodiesterase n=1 Tax=Acidianus sulfidivorans JP7 TaxID=619593 RepID=A0A2U9INV9_9CREN|nr:RNA 2',3'-cyclic phosphodiesterase [Acidianus sulfidivorans]AWR97676.1 RNA 2',3'-cyclic phosphodiesterase [Acidianus sulfidivorans JP7]
MRLFIAVQIPQLHKIFNVINEINLTGADIKLVEPENIHITLVFLGEVNDDKLDLVKDSMLSLKFNQFKVTLKGMGTFPSISRPRVVWIGISSGFEELRNIRSTLIKELGNRKIRPADDKDFVPHITLGRVRGPSNIANLIDFVNRYRDEEFGEFVVNKVILFKSTLTPKGPIYNELLGVKAID